ncbi:phosphotransferase [Streptomyces sp. DSM 44915]|uniref:Phosphotransferase n=1 Tax=Streptomyces chisholmiae TaxID=3075540 RepID=A0ABU2JPY9_9ACTN|nr:phosphotransferase [Streptomyces sp. DSM 44915]MDT0267044.1 phosphotransferase [Streptomyces sp. DSM 44915]
MTVEAAAPGAGERGRVARHGPEVVKTHRADTDPAALRVRVQVARWPGLGGVLLPPLAEPAVREGRLVTRWPYGEPVDQAVPERYPWAAAGALLARLHAAPLAELPGPLPAAGGRQRLARAVRRLRGLPPEPRLGAARRLVLRAHRRPLPPPGRQPALCHGDFHLGQLVRAAGPPAGWRLIDIDDLGVGDPAWDLARPAAWYAAGLLPPEDWQQLLAGYRLVEPDAAGAAGDPWPWLEGPARALTVQSAAQEVARAQLEARQLSEAGVALVDACGRIAGLP